MKCNKCGSEKVNVQALAIQKRKRKGLVYWLCCLWVFDLILWLIWTIPMLFISIFKPKKHKTVVKSYAVCQTCGNQWKV